MGTKEYLRNKTILLISPQNWGMMHISKHHYAIELARRGNTVYFLTPLELTPGNKKKIIIHKTEIEGLFIIEQYLFFPFQIKFHSHFVFKKLMQWQLNRILRKIAKSIDIIWSFDLGNFFSFSHFEPKCLKVFHPVDEPLNKAAYESAKGADIIFSVTKEILEKYKNVQSPGFYINHGLADCFLEPVVQKRKDGSIIIGFSGNLLVNYLDRKTLLQIISENSLMQFKFWGAYERSQSNIGGSDTPNTRKFISTLQSLKNVSLLGIMPPEQLALELNSVDAFLMCYDIKKEQSNGTNYHKLMEYFSTGKVVISNNITNYSDAPNLVQMVSNRENNLELPILFKEVVHNLHYHNQLDFQKERMSFASENTYSNQVSRIDEILSQYWKENCRIISKT